MSSDIILAIFIFLITTIWTILAVPIVLLTVGKKLPDFGWGMTTVLGWLMIAVPVWFLAHFGLPINTKAGVYLITIGWIVFDYWLIKKNNLQVFKLLNSNAAYIITQEILFLFGFITLILIRGHKPEILDLEKFMDAGIMMTYLTHHTLPAPDMWLAGYTINYYTFGHFLGAIATHFWGQPLTISYNLLVGLICGLTLKGAASAIMNLSLLSLQKSNQRIVIISSVLGALLVTFGGNSHKAWYLLKNFITNQEIQAPAYWYPDATRFIHNTIHEFPAYSFVVSDLHAHVFSLPLIIFYIPLVYVWFSSLVPLKKLSEVLHDHPQPIYYAVALGSLLGFIASTSTWDVLIIGIGLCILGVITLIRNYRYFPHLVVSALIIGLTAIITSAPWWLNFESISEGICLVKEYPRSITTDSTDVDKKLICNTALRTPIWQLLVLWAGHGFATLLSIFTAIDMIKRSKSNTTWTSKTVAWFRTEDTTQIKVLILVLSLGILSFVLLLLPEIIYMKDIYPDHPRANTMFKLTFHSFVIMSILSGWLLAVSLNQITKLKHLSVIGCLLVISLYGVASIYPKGAFRDYYGLGSEIRSYKGLDGLQWLKNQHPDDYAAIMWLNYAVTEKPVIAEAVGESYTVFARVSTFTGMPTILGWRVHEWLWRGSFDIPGARTPEVEKIYIQPTNYEVQTILSKYKVKYIFVGDKEREAYPTLDETGLRNLGRVVFSSGNTFVVEL